jgi:YidC/Oxa1 family membrane protein insertase
MFSFIDMIIVRPIVNILFVIYNLVGDFGLAIIIFTVLVKLAMTPLMIRQFRQTRAMRQIQPELAEIKKRCKGNRQMESLQMMDLYKRKNIKPMRTMLTTFLQLPIFIAIFTAINVSVQPCIVNDEYNVAISRCAKKTDIEYNVNHSAYPFVRELPAIKELIEKQGNYFASYTENSEEAKYEFEPKLFGSVDLAVRASEVFSNFNLSTAVVMIFAICSTGAQFIMTRMNNPNMKKGKRRTMKTLLKEAADGKEASQEDINAVAQGQMTYMMPLMMLFIMLNLPGALALYYLLNNTITIIMQKIFFKKKFEEMEESADKKILKELREAKEAEIVEKPSEDKKTHYANDSKNKNENVHITRIKASDKKKRR